MTVAILHHAGDANDPPVRVAGTVALARRAPCRVFALNADGPQLITALGAYPVFFIAIEADDTVGEVRATLPWMRDVDTLYISTEPGHLARAVLIARILYWRRGVRIVPWPSAPGAYRSPWRLTVRDVFRALWWRATHR